MTSQRVYLIRHGQTDWNMEGRFQGMLSVPMNAIGYAQSRALAAAFAYPISAIYTSDLSRAFDTAKILGEALQITPKVDERLREINFGIFQGLTRAEIEARYPHEYTQYRESHADYQIPQGESRAQLQERAYTAWQDITAQEPTRDFAIVSHGALIKNLLVRLFPTQSTLTTQHLNNTSVTILERNRTQDNAAWTLAALALTAHLETTITDQDNH